jgi:nucleoside-triphosphatase
MPERKILMANSSLVRNSSIGIVGWISRVFCDVIHHFRWITMQKTHLIYPASSFAPAANSDKEILGRPPEKKIYIISGPIQSGKTSALLQWSATRNDVYGILTPIINGKRVFMNAHSREQFAMEADDRNAYSKNTDGKDADDRDASNKDVSNTDASNKDAAVINIGRYSFSQTAFNKAKEIIRTAIGQANWLLIDEIGPLELNNQGFADVLQEALAALHHEQTIVLVVREGLREKVKEKFGIA